MLYALLQFIYKGFTVHNVSLFTHDSWDPNPDDLHVYKTSNMREWKCGSGETSYELHIKKLQVYTLLSADFFHLDFIPLPAWTEKWLISGIFSCLIYLRHIKCHHRYRCHLIFNLKLQLMIPHNKSLNSNKSFTHLLMKMMSRQDTIYFPLYFWSN